MYGGILLCLQREYRISGSNLILSLIFLIFLSHIPLEENIQWQRNNLISLWFWASSCTCPWPQWDLNLIGYACLVTPAHKASLMHHAHSKKLKALSSKDPKAGLMKLWGNYLFYTIPRTSCMLAYLIYTKPCELNIIIPILHRIKWRLINIK